MYIIVVNVSRMVYNVTIRGDEMSTSAKNSRITARINKDVKERAEIELERHGLNVSDFVRIAVTTVANDGLPKYFGLPNATVNESIIEMAEDISKDQLQDADNAKDLEKLLDVWNNSNK